MSPLTEISGRASPAGLSAETSSTKEPEQKKDEQQYMYRCGQRTQNPHTFNTFNLWGSPRHNAPLPYKNHKIGAASNPTFGNGNLPFIISCMERWELSINKDINIVLNAIYSSLRENRPPLNLQLCFLRGLVVNVCTFKTCKYSKSYVKIMLLAV